MCQGEERSVYVGKNVKKLIHNGANTSRSMRGRSKTPCCRNISRKNTMVTGKFKKCLSRQVAEGVEIRKSAANLMNAKSE
jgi:hypothetical protein